LLQAIQFIIPDAEVQENRVRFSGQGSRSGEAKAASWKPKESETGAKKSTLSRKNLTFPNPVL
jgi:hypothetical protein